LGGRDETSGARLVGARLLRVELRKARYEQMFSALPPTTDIDGRRWQVCFVPILLQKSACRRGEAADAIFLKPLVATSSIERATYARFY
jgi:hypothetical protein